MSSSRFTWVVLMRIDDRSRTRVLSAVGLLFGAALALVACPGKLDDGDDLLFHGEGGAPGCDRAPEIFQKSCAGASCHSPPNPQQGLDLVSADVGARVVDRLASGCDGNLADPTDPEGSVLVQMLGDSPPCGERMPKGGAALSADDVACIAAWIVRLQPPAGTGGAGGSTGGAGGMGGGNLGGGAG